MPELDIQIGDKSTVLWSLNENMCVSWKLIWKCRLKNDGYVNPPDSEAERIFMENKQLHRQDNSNHGID